MSVYCGQLLNTKFQPLQRLEIVEYLVLERCVRKAGNFDGGGFSLKGIARGILGR